MADSVGISGMGGIGGLGSASYTAGMEQASLKSEQSKATAFEDALKAATERGKDEEIMEAAREFESYFLQTMLKEMRKTVPNDGLIPRGNAEEIFQSMLDEEYSKNAAKGTGIGVAQMIYEQMTRDGKAPVNISYTGNAEPLISAARLSTEDDEGNE